MTGEKAKIFHEVLCRGLVSEADKTDAEFLKKVAEYIKYSDKNPLDAGEDTVVRFVKAKDLTTKIGDTPIDGLVTLKRGSKLWGLTHLEIRGHINDIISKFNLNSEEEAIDLICSATYKYYKKIKDPKGGYDLFYYVSGADKDLKVVVNPGNGKGIITAYPED